MTRSEILAKRLLEAEPQAPPPPEQEPTTPTPKMDTHADVKGEIDKLLPTRQYRFVGSRFWNAAGMLNLALRGFQLGIKSDQKWGLNVMRAMNAPEDVIDALIQGRADVEAQGDDAIVTVKLYADKPRNRKSSRRTPPR